MIKTKHKIIGEVSFSIDTALSTVRAPKKAFSRKTILNRNCPV
jgi:hypothetical protein